MKQYFVVLMCCALCLIFCAKSKNLPPPAPPPAESMGKVVMHRVERGETWQSISRDFYGDEGRARELAQDNASDLLIAPRPGSTIRVLVAAHEADEAQAKLEASRAYDAGLDLASAGRYADAALRFQEALRLNPKLHEASFNLAVSYQKLGYHDKAIDILRDLIVVSPGNVDYLYALGASLFETGEFAEARRTFSDVLARDSANRKALFSFAVACEKTGKLDQARSSFERYLALDPHGEWSDAARAHLESLRSRR